MKLAATLILSALLASTVATAEAPTGLLEVGSAAPAFKLPSQDGSTISLEQFRGQWVVLYFYPKDMTKGCTIEAHNFQRDLAAFEKRKAVVLGVSVDSPDSHKEFCTKEELTFRLLADTDHAVSTAYGVLKERDGVQYAGRVTYLIDPAGVIRKVYEKVDVTKHSEEVQADLDRLQAEKS
jgi:peroxiredoxin Q/BCP